VFAVDFPAVDDDIKNTAAAGNEFSVDAFGVFDCGRQTGGLW